MAKILVRLTNKLIKDYCKISTPDIKTAGIIVIGDEILKGDVVDTNSQHMTPKLHSLGIQVKKVSVIGDNLKEISDEVQLFSKQYTYVITSGGIGPTHDDVTFEAIAKAFNEPIIVHPELVKMCIQFYKTTDPNYPGMKLAHVPQSAKLTFLEDPTTGKKTNYPCISMGNVYILPGIPQLCQKTFDLLCSTKFQSANKFYTKNIYFNITEDKIAPSLDTLVKEFPNVLIGSYPQWNNSKSESHLYGNTGKVMEFFISSAKSWKLKLGSGNYVSNINFKNLNFSLTYPEFKQLFFSSYKVKITIESMHEESTNAAFNKLINIVPDGSIVTV